ncbi:MAG: sigma-70 family RNA polymerase sigma factor, partial [Acidimicrobiales bacterium]
EERFVAAGRTDASSTEIAELAGMTVGELDKLRAQVRQGVIVALDRPVRMGDSTVSLGDTIADDDAEDPAEMLEAREMKAYVRSAIHLLPERHRLVIVAYFLEEKPMDEIAAFLGVTQSRVSQIKDDALKRIRAGVAVQYQTEPSEAPVRRRRDRSRAEYAAAIGKHSTPMERLVDVDGIGAV